MNKNTRPVVACRARIIITTLLTFVALTGWAQNNFTVSGDLSILTSKIYAPARVDTVYILNDSTMIIPAGKKQEKYAVKDGKFEISGNVSRPYYSNLVVQMEIEADGKKHKTSQDIPFILEPGNIVLGTEWVLFGGTPLNDASIAMCNRLGELKNAGETDKLKQEAFDFVKQHAADPASIYVIVQADNFMKAKDILTMIEMCSDEIQHTFTDLALLREKLTKEANSPQEGDKFADFAVEYEGKTTRLSDYVGRGQYVLVDFWASWCVPCRREIPNLIAAYNKYKDRGLMVLGVAAWDEPENTKKAIDEDKIPYPQILNSQKIAADTYGIAGIPRIILFAPDGTIVANGLRGENIEKKLAEIYK